MRLSTKEINGIIESITHYLKHPFEVRLYGSRLDDNAKGGDIDLLLIIDDAALEKAQWNKHVLLACIKQAIGDQKIDLSICSLTLINTNPFLSMVYPLSKTIN